MKDTKSRDSRDPLTTKGPSRAQQAQEAKTREARLVEALRENLRKRKVQAQGRTSAAGDAPASAGSKKKAK